MMSSKATATLLGTLTREGTYSFTIRAERRYSTNYTPASDTINCTLMVQQKPASDGDKDDEKDDNDNNSGNNNSKPLNIIGNFSNASPERSYMSFIEVEGGKTTI